MGKQKRTIITGIEIGTSTIKVVIGEMLSDDIVAVLGACEVPSLKVVKGEIADVQTVQEHLERAINIAEAESGLSIESVFLAVTGAHIRTVNSVGTTFITTTGRPISEDDVVAAARNAHAYNLPPDREGLHFYDRCYRVDGSREVVNPIGQFGAKLDADVHIIYGTRNRIETNRSMVAEVMGYGVADIAFSPVAASMAAFSPEEAQRGALLVDIGAGVTEFIMHYGAGCFHSGQITVGCEHIANDLSIGLRLPLPRCRKMLHDLGKLECSAVMKSDGRDRLIMVETPGHATRRIPGSAVEQIIEARLGELFGLINAELGTADCLPRIGTGVRLSGGGALIPGVDKLAQRVFETPVAPSRPRLIGGFTDHVDNPRFMTPVGLIRYGRMMLDIGAHQNLPLWRQLKLDMTRTWHAIARALQW